MIDAIKCGHLQKMPAGSYVGYTPWRCSLKARIVSALAGFLVCFCLPLCGQAVVQVTDYGDSAPALPRSMRLCVNSQCSTLSLINGHYDGVKDGEHAVSMAYQVKRWDSSGIELIGISVPGARERGGSFIGKFVQGNHNTVEGEVKWSNGLLITAPDTYQLTWNDDARAGMLSGISAFPSGQPPVAPETRLDGQNSSDTTDGRSWMGASRQSTPAPTTPSVATQYKAPVIVPRDEVSRTIYEGLWRDPAATTPYFGYTASNSDLPLPASMRFCDINCVTLQLKDGEYWDISGNEKWTVGTFTRQSAEFTRTVKNPAFSVTYNGSVSEDGNSLVGVSNPFRGGQGQPENIFLTWDLATVQKLTAQDPRYTMGNRQQFDPALGLLLLFGVGAILSGDSSAAPPPRQPIPDIRFRIPGTPEYRQVHGGK